MKITPADKSTPCTDFTVSSTVSGKSYRVALRGMQRGQGYCSCPDFRKNHLGLCKHILKAQEWAKKQFDTKTLQKTPKPSRLSVFVRYVGDLSIGLEVPARLKESVKALVTKWDGKFAQSDAEITALFDTIRRITQADGDILVCLDAEEIISQAVHRQRMKEMVAEIRKAPAQHPLRKTLLHTELLPYQMDGIAFAVGAGRAVLADEMGLGKTIQGVGVAEFLARFAGVQKVLFVCPASLKSQWLAEIRRFCDRSVQKRRLEVLLGSKPEAESDVSQQQQVATQITTLQAEQKAKIAEASGTLLTSAFTLLSQALPNASAPDETIVTALKSSLTQCLEPTENGQTKLTITLPGAEALETMARALATLMAAGK